MHSYKSAHMETEWEWGGIDDGWEDWKVGGQDQANLGLHTNEIQLNICANSESSVGFFSGIVKSSMCEEGFKTSREWYGDTTSSQYRHAA